MLSTQRGGTAWLLGDAVSEVITLKINSISLSAGLRKCSKCSLAPYCVMTDDSGRNGPQCYHRGELARGEMGKGESGRHRRGDSETTLSVMA